MIMIIGIRNVLSLMWLYLLIKIPPPRFPKSFPRMWQMKIEKIPVVVGAFGRKAYERNSRKH